VDLQLKDDRSAPLNLERISEKLATSQYGTARYVHFPLLRDIREALVKLSTNNVVKDFQFDVILMFAMHRVTKTNEKEVYQNLNMASLFKDGWHTPVYQKNYLRLSLSSRKKYDGCFGLRNR
jgi:hypothetical protein